MVPWVLLETARAPDGDMLRLLRRGEEFSIRIAGGNELMNSRLGGSEEALARLAIEAIAPCAAPRILIGGLGMGFTLRAARALTGPEARIEVAEIVPQLVGWAGTHMSEVFGDCLSDPRVSMRIGDVGKMIRDAAPGAHDAILLDVDNGPDGLTRPGNDSCYGEAGLRAAYRALAPGGVLNVWSAAPDPAFTRRLEGCGFAAEAIAVRAARRGRGSRHMIWRALRPAWGEGGAGDKARARATRKGASAARIPGRVA
ncbi:spermidine synthase [Profundibacterium mesophilum]|uniref:Spermidine synthase n=1 Tax=Profundibacterium mesophilum KAUST100406-0324 TaxID=1037889 RepID=A0A921NQ91_9RHOB|nr:spermidine synthase [Profundibacterium mesophilum]KAF0676162.1 spermidine synthase [Profundibacterium mesophilum KAUST100406-0324]